MNPTARCDGDFHHRKRPHTSFEDNEGTDTCEKGVAMCTQPSYKSSGNHSQDPEPKTKKNEQQG